MLLAEDHKFFAQEVNELFEDKEELKFSEEECKQVNELLFSNLVSLL